MPFFDSDHLVIANIASAGSARNIERNARVCVAFIDVFAQKGFKVTGAARNVRKNDPDFVRWATQLVEMAGPRFAIQSVFVVKAEAVEAILAPSYRLYPTRDHGRVPGRVCHAGIRRAAGAERCLTPRSSAAPTDGHQARSGGTRCVVANRALAPCRRHPIYSSVGNEHLGSSVIHTMKCLVVIAHPLADSACHAMARSAVDALTKAGHDVQIEDLYQSEFSPALTASERQSYYGPVFDAASVRSQADRLLSAEAIVLVFPTWWIQFPRHLEGLV